MIFLGCWGVFVSCLFWIINCLLLNGCLGIKLGGRVMLLGWYYFRYFGGIFWGLWGVVNVVYRKKGLLFGLWFLMKFIVVLVNILEV